MIVRNEEQHLAGCLASVVPAVDEIIVVDTGSSDRTLRIAHAMGAKVFSYSWNDDFSAARNHAIDQATGEWIFVLDADELLSPGDHSALRALVEGSNDRKGYGFVTRNYVTAIDMRGWHANDYSSAEERGSGWVPSPKVRLFPRDAGIRFTNPVHEVVEPALAAAEIPLVSCTIPIHHYGRLDEAKVRVKGEWYAALGRKRLEEGRPDDRRSLLDLASQEQELGHHDRAIDLWVRQIDRFPEDASAYFGLGVSLCALGSYEGALGPLRKAMELDPGLREAPVKYALSLLHVGRASEACSVLEHAYRQEDRHPAALAAFSAAAACAGDHLRSQGLLRELSNNRIACNVFLRGLSNELRASGQEAYARAVEEMTSEAIQVPI
jgi:tetratricopeptide (TPR) repeat protein